MRSMSLLSIMFLVLVGCSSGSTDAPTDTSVPTDTTSPGDVTVQDGTAQDVPSQDVPPEDGVEDTTQEDVTPEDGQSEDTTVEDTTAEDVPPVDPCDPNPCQNDSACIAGDDGSFSCSCAQGWTGDLCDEDVDECSDPDISCQENATCNNTLGSYECVCDAGYWFNDADFIQACMDIDECAADPGPCGQDATCENSDGSFACVCADGFVLDEQMDCVDIDECAPFALWAQDFTIQPSDMTFFASDIGADPPKADPVGWFITTEGKLQYSNATGTNYNGSTSGEAYLPKMDFVPNMSLTATVSFDDDETNPFYDYAYISILSCSGEQDLSACMAAQADPDPEVGEAAGVQSITLFMNLDDYVDASGNALPGGTELDLNIDLSPHAGISGWLVFGFFSPNQAANIGSGFIIDDVTVFGPHPQNTCQLSATCENTSGSFECTCEAGFEPDGEQGCADVDECLDDPCQENAVCSNTEGGFECACAPGFDTVGESCVDVDECTNQTLFSEDFTVAPQDMIFVNSDSASALDPPKPDPVSWFVSEDGKLRYSNADGTNYNGINTGEAVLPKMTFKEGMTLSANLAIDLDETNPFSDYVYITITTCTGEHDWASCNAMLMDPDASDEDAESLVLFVNLDDYVDADGNPLPDGSVLDVDVDLSEYAGMTGWITFGFWASNGGDNIGAGLTIDDVVVTQSAVSCVNGTCENTVGSFTCVCDPDFTPWDETTCTDGMVDLTGLALRLYQNGFGPDFLKSEFMLEGMAPVGSYIIAVRNVEPNDDTLLQFSNWSAMWSPALPLDVQSSVFAMYSSGGAWQVNGPEDVVALADTLSGEDLEVVGPNQDTISTRQADGSWLQGPSSVWATGQSPPNMIQGVQGPVYIYEVGEKGGSTELGDYNGNYVILYIAGP